MKTFLLLIIFIFLSFSQDYLLYGFYELEELSKFGLKLKRNEIFARHGQPFKNKYLKQYFSYRNWYKPIDNKKVSKKELTKEELKILEEIIALEKKSKSEIKVFSDNKKKYKLILKQTTLAEYSFTLQTTDFEFSGTLNNPYFGLDTESMDDPETGLVFSAVIYSYRDKNNDFKVTLDFHGNRLFLFSQSRNIQDLFLKAK